jgi:hypothetical protein
MCGWQTGRQFQWRVGGPNLKGIALPGEEGLLGSAQRCHDLSAECRRLMKLAPTEAEAQILKNLSRSWAGLAGQIDRYNALLRQRRHAVSSKGPREQGSP